MTMHGRSCSWVAVAGALLMGASGCSQAEDGRSTGSVRAPLAAAAAGEARSSAAGPQRVHLIAWGEGPGQAGYRPAREQALARGPSAIAVLPSGEPVVLDSLNERLLKIGPSGAVESLVPARPDDEDLAVDADGAIALYSPLRSSVVMRDAHGSELGEVLIPRALRDVQGLSFASSRRLVARTAYQETYALGSPQAPRSLESTLQSKKEGAAFLADGRGVSIVRSKEGRLDLLVLATDPSAGRTVVARRIELAVASSGRILGAWGTEVCARLETALSSPSLSISVSAEVVCVDAASGQRTWQQSLPAPGLYAPRTPLAMGGAPPRLAVLDPREEGLAVMVQDALRGEPRGGAR